MCGIYGLVWPGAPADVVDVRMEALANRLPHRGPDADGRVVRPGVGIGTRRLAIVEPAGNRQPVVGEDGCVWAVLNGEIYNYGALRDRLARSHLLAQPGDAEVLVHLYEELGNGFVAELRGMFSIAVWDDRRRTLLLARDRLGEKPLYIFRNSEYVAFASELQALEGLPEFDGAIDEVSFVRYLACGYVPGPRTIRAGAKRVAPATVVAIDAELRERTTSYWSVPAPDSGSATQADVEEALERACREQSSGPARTALLLSGGLDSSLIAAFVAGAGRRGVPAFTVHYPGHEVTDDLRYACEVAAAFDMNLHPVAISADDLMDGFPRFVARIDEPMADPTALSLLLAAEAVAPHARVLLTGAGADELFAGYPEHRHAPTDASASAHRWSNPFFPDAFSVPRSTAMRLLTRRARSRLPSGEPVGWFVIDALLRDDSGGLWRSLVADLTSRLPDLLLAMGDRMTMAASVEARSPFLDVGVVEAAMRLPAEAKLGPLSGKRVLAEIGRGRLPAGVQVRSKQGFPSVLLGVQFDAVVLPLWSQVREACASQLCTYVAPKGVDYVERAARLGVPRARKILWRLTVFFGWLHASRTGSSHTKARADPRARPRAG